MLKYQLVHLHLLLVFIYFAIFKRGMCRPQLAHAWFLKIDPVRIVSMRVCPRLRLLITSGVM